MKTRIEPPPFVTAVAGNSLMILTELMFLVFAKNTLQFFFFQRKNVLEKNIIHYDITKTNNSL